MNELRFDAIVKKSIDKVVGFDPKKAIPPAMRWLISEDEPIDPKKSRPTIRWQVIDGDICEVAPQIKWQI